MFTASAVQAPFLLASKILVLPVINSIIAG
jgi:hypothetical protein